jgi:AmmeMemoRadiSam system protein B
MPAVAGSFYPDSSAALRKKIAALVGVSGPKEECLACLLPHAGYLYSGRVAALTLSRVNIKARVILIGPNHTGYGAEFSLMKQGSWRTPLGDVEIDTALAEAILAAAGELKADELAHQREHSLEVELPLLQYFKPVFKIVPITVYPAPLELLKRLGRQIAAAVSSSVPKEEVLIVASSDMTHYEPQAQAEEKDRLAIEALLELDEDRLFSQVSRFNISMCGLAPAVMMLSAAKELGAKAAKLVKYQTSAEATQDRSAVVGYAGILIS